MKQHDILSILLHTNEYVSGQALAGTLGVSRQAVWKGIRALKEQGYGIESVPNRGYRLRMMPGCLNEAALRSSLSAAIIGCELEVLETVGSTNDYLKELAAKGCRSGTVVAAREQVSGKGRLGRTWQSKKDENIAFSVLLRPHIAPTEVACITPLAGLAVCKALRAFTGLDCKIKWPNDVITGRKKLCGILTEMSAEFDAVEYIITGIGINVDQTEFPAEIADKATSLLLETGTRFDKNKLLACILQQMEEEFLRDNLELTPQALEEYVSLCVTVGRAVGFTRGGKTFSGTAEGVAPNGALLVKLDSGEVTAVSSGEVTAQGIY